METTLNDLGKNEITNLNNPNCTNCNECCNLTASVNKKELNDIVNIATIHTDIKRFVYQKIQQNKKMLFDDKYLNLYCLFSNMQNKKCMIYKYRPHVCRIFHCSNEYFKLFKNDCYIYTMVDVLIEIMNKFGINKNNEDMIIIEHYKHASNTFMNNSIDNYKG